MFKHSYILFLFNLVFYHFFHFSPLLWNVIINFTIFVDLNIDISYHAFSDVFQSFSVRDINTPQFSGIYVCQIFNTIIIYLMVFSFYKPVNVFIFFDSAHVLVTSKKWKSNLNSIVKMLILKVGKDKCFWSLEVYRRSFERNISYISLSWNNSIMYISLFFSYQTLSKLLNFGIFYS